MSQENVERVRRIYEEVNARLEFPPEWFDPDCVSDWTDVAPDGELIRGLDTTNAAIAPYFRTFENFSAAIRTPSPISRTLGYGNHDSGGVG